MQIICFYALESTLDNFKTINKLDEEVEKLNFRISQKNHPQTLAIIEDIKICSLYKKSILPIKNLHKLLNVVDCNYIEQRHVNFLEIKDLCLTLIDSCDMILASLESATNLFFSVQGHRMNQVMKT